MNKTDAPNYRSFKNNDDKYFYAAYLNTAVQNVFITLRDISEKYSLNFPTSNDTQMLNCSLFQLLKNNKELEVSNKVIEQLKHAFPFLDYVAINRAQKVNNEIEASPIDYYTSLHLFVDILIKYRNFYSHKIHNDTVRDKLQIAQQLNDIFDSARRKVKERFNLSANDVDHLVRSKGKGKPNWNFKYQFDDNSELTEKGFLFFVSLWLTRKDTQTLLKKHAGFKRSELTHEKATVETYSYYCIRMPQPRLNSDRSDKAILLDMINELKKCPKYLFNHLSREDKDKFIDYELLNNNTDDLYETLPLQRRIQNRFYYFALCYLEKHFTTLKFHIDLGNYSFHTYEQEIEGVVRTRRWVKKLFAFGNVDDFAEDNQPAYWKAKVKKLADEEQNVNQEIYISHTTPHYHFSDNVKTIGFMFNGNYDKDKTSGKLWPEIYDYETKPKDKSVRKAFVPHGWLSLYDLPAICFYEYLHNAGIAQKSAEVLIREYRDRIILFFEDVKNEVISNGFTKSDLVELLESRNLQLNHIPKSIVDYLCNNNDTSIETIAPVRLNEMLDTTNNLLGKIKVSAKHFEEKPGSKNYVEMKCGTMADYIARDLLLLQPKIGKDKGKANSTEFQVLQAKLAYFGANKDTLHHTFRLCNLIDSDNPHPFIASIDISKCKGILEFYKEYLFKRKKYLLQCLKEKQYNKYQFLKLQRDKHTLPNGKFKYICDSVSAMQQTINVPRNLFTKPILKTLQSDETCMPLIQELNKTESVNIAFIIEKYFEIVRNDSTQEFYSFKRSYDVLNKVFDKRKRHEMRKPLDPQPFSNEDFSSRQKEFKQKIQSTTDTKKKAKYKKLYKKLLDNEQNIRLEKTCDSVLFCMIHEMYSEIFLKDKDSKKQQVSFSDKFKLQEITPTTDKGILSQQEKVSMEYTYKYETNKNFITDRRNNISEINTATKTIVNESIKIKNYGNFRALLKDRRIASLLPYIDAQEIHTQALEKELEWFGEARLKVFKHIHAFEQKVIEAKGLTKNKQEYISHDYILKHANADSNNILLINLLRNAFSHSEYPPYAIFKNMIDGSNFNSLMQYSKDDETIKARSIIIQLQNITLSLYDELINSLN